MAGSEFFSTQILSAYQRNRNSRSKTKNLRCFPCCSVPGKHMSNGFCGQSVVVTIPSSTVGSVQNICAYARFIPKETPTTVDILPAKELDEVTDVRSKNNPCCQWIRVRFSSQGDGNVVFTINPDLLGWHYGWRSNKNTRNTLHVLRLYVFRKAQSGSQLKLICELSSSAFVMYSGNNKIDTASLVQSLVHKRKIGDTQLLEGEALASAGSRDSRESKPKVLCADPNSGTDVLSVPSSVVTTGHDDFDLRRLLQQALDMAKRRPFRPGQLSTARTEHHGTTIVSSPGTEQEGTLQLFEMLFEGDSGVMCLEESSCNASGNRSKLLLDKQVNQVLRTITSSKLSQEVASFLYDCTTGPVGSTLCETLRAMEMPTTNPFFEGFSRSLFFRFQRVIARRVEYDLFEAGCLTESQLSAGYKNLTGAEGVFNDKHLVFESQDARTLSRFVDLLKIYSSLPNLDQSNIADPTPNPYALVNKTWRDVAQGQMHWFIDVIAGEFGLCHPYLAFIIGKANYIRKMHATRERFISVGSPVLTFTGHVDLVADNRIRILNQQAPPLFEYLEMVKRTYVYRHKVDAEGFVQQYTFINVPRTGLVVNFAFTEASVKRHAPDELQIINKLLIVPRPETDVPRVGDDALDLLDRIKAHPNPSFSPSTQARQIQFAYIRED